MPYPSPTAINKNMALGTVPGAQGRQAAASQGHALCLDLGAKGQEDATSKSIPKLTVNVLIA